MKEVVRDDNNVWTKYALGILNDIDRDVIKKMIMAFGFDAGYYGTKTVRRNREKLHCNVPFIILLTPRARATSTARAVGLRNTATSKALRTKRCRA